MKKRGTDPESVWKEYEKGVAFNTGINLYDAMRTNENFFIGKQWEGVQSNGLPTPVFNFLKRVVLFSVASVSTDNLKLHATPIPSSGPRDRMELEVVSSILNDQFVQLFSFNRSRSLFREFCRNAAVDGDGFLYTWWDESAVTGQTALGFPRTECLLATQVMFANPNSRDVQSQPYLLITRRMLVSQARDRAERFGVGPEDRERIVPDDKETMESGDLDALGGEKVTVILRLWKEKDGSVRGVECTRDVCIRREWDLNLSLYPITYMSWDYVQDCYHGQSMITGLIPNQVFVNKLFAMSMISLMTTAYPKVLYDRTRIKKWSNQVGAAIPMNGGDVNSAVKIVDPAAISPQISQFIELAISYTQKFLGASDVALGDTRPDNTSAIVALQRASSVPMEITKQNLLSAIEDQGRIYQEFMKRYYGVRFVEVPRPDGNGTQSITFDFSTLEDIPMSINLEAGASAYWSEIATMQTLDNLLMQGKISTVDYLKRLPAGQITDRETLIAALSSQTATAGGDMVQPPTGDATTAAPEAPLPVIGGRGNRTLQRSMQEMGGKTA